MTNPTTALDLRELLAEQPFVQRLARSLVTDASEADDIVQQVYLSTLEARRNSARAAPIRNPRAWLTQVVRRMARDRGLAAKRRTQHERNAAREDILASPADLIEVEEQRRRLVDAVTGLSEPYRSALVRRYRAGWSIAKMARNGDVTVAAIESRLRRAKAMVRKQLGEGKDPRWALGLVPLAVGFHTKAALGGTGAIGTWIMMKKTKFVALGAAAVLLASVATWMLWRPADAPHEPERSTMAAAPADRADGSPVDRPRAEAMRTEQPPEQVVPASTPDPSVAVLRGRAVDPDGNPLANVAVELTGRIGNADREAAYVRRHGRDSIHWQPPGRVVTASDGRFELRFVPPPPYQFALSLTHEEYPACEGNWSELEPGAQREFGDIRFEVGSVVRGRLVDREGRALRAPDAKTRLDLSRAQRADRPRGEITPKQQHWVDVHPDGTFAFPERIALGVWDVSCSKALFVTSAEQRTARPPEVEITEPQQTLQLAIVPPRETPRITGRVVDPSGQPVRRAIVDVEYEDDQRTTWELETTDRDGRFSLIAHATTDPKQPVRLSVRAKGYQSLITPEAWPWHSHGLQITLQTGIRIPVKVLSAATDQPIEQFRLHVARPDQDVWAASTQTGGTRHAGGMAEAIATTVATYRVAVIPEATSGLAASMQTIDTRPGRVEPLVFRLRPAVRQPIRVRFRDGRPCPDSQVELIDSEGAEITATTAIRRPDRRVWPSVGRLIDEAQTDEQGRATITGPPKTTLTLRIRGDHSAVIQVLQLTDEPIDLTLELGTRLNVTAQPASVLARWREYTRTPWMQTHIELFRETAGGEERFPAPSEPAVLDEQGKVSIVGATPGAWSVRLHYPEGEDSGTSIVVAERLMLQNGAPQTLAVDLSRFLAGTVTLSATINDKPAKNASILLRQLATDGKQPPEQLALDKSGRFHGPVSQGTWQVALMLEGDADPLIVPHADRLIVTEGQTSEVEFAFRVGTQTVRLLTPDGKPASNVPLLAKWNDDLESSLRARTNADGETVLRGGLGTYRLLARPKDLIDRRAHIAYWVRLLESHGGDQARAIDAMLADLVDLGPIKLTTDGVPVTIRLPESWNR